ncbi:hypothetical protein Gogos_015079, partial [Gossypium gossypioides]|nr:hypothetical protein [Gossypium gossypioides]
HLYNWKILLEIGELVGKVVRLDFNTDNRARALCPTAKMVVVEEGEQSAGARIEKSDAATESTDREVDSVNYGPWMLVEKKLRQKSKEDRVFRARNWGIDLVDLISNSYLSRLREMVKAKGLGRNLRDRG